MFSVYDRVCIRPNAAELETYRLAAPLTGPLGVGSHRGRFLDALLVIVLTNARPVTLQVTLLAENVAGLKSD